MLVFWLRAAALLILCIPSLASAIGLQVDITGLPEKLNESVRADLHIQHAISEPKLTEARIHNLYDLAESQILATLQAKGYYHSKVTAELAKIDGTTPDQDKWVAHYTIELGKATTILSVELNVDGPGKDNPKIKPFLIMKKLVPGNILTHEDYEDTKEKLLSDLNSIGYLKASFTQNVIEIDKTEHSAKIKFSIETGIIYVFGKVSFVDKLYSDELLDRYIPFKAGQPYETQKLIEFQQNLEKADLFSKIRFDPTVNLDEPLNNTVPIEVRLTAKPRNRYTGSVGYGTDTGPRASVGWLHRRTETEGHKVLTNITASKIRRAGKINYIIPGKRAATDRYILGAIIQEDHFNDIYSRKSEIFGNSGIKRGKTETLYGVNLFTETYRIIPSDPKRTKNYLLPNARWTWTDSDSKDDLEYGTQFDLRIRGGAKGILSDNNVIQTEAVARKIILVAEKTRLLFRTNLGAVTTKDFLALPPSLRFYSGGDTSVRGYRYNSLGPKVNSLDGKSEAIGGRYLFVASAELERTIIDKLRAAVFFDAGNVAMKFKGPLAMSPGVGIRYNTPIGNFRVDVAKPLNLVVNKHWRINMTFGTDF